MKYWGDKLSNFSVKKAVIKAITSKGVETLEVYDLIRKKPVSSGLYGPFYKKVNLKSRKAMIDFLTGHFRYHTMNSWNNATGYAHNMKIYNLGLTSEQQDSLYEIMEVWGSYDPINDLIYDFDVEHCHRLQAYFNGRNGGYLVMCEGGISNGESYSYPGRGIDHNEDFSEWTMDMLRKRVKEVQDFDVLADAILEEAIYLAENFKVEDQTVMVSKKVKVLKEKAA
jgi:hypothetical protein